MLQYYCQSFQGIVGAGAGEVSCCGQFAVPRCWVSVCGCRDLSRPRPALIRPKRFLAVPKRGP